jgi:hypothetical protein
VSLNLGVVPWPLCNSKPSNKCSLFPPFHTCIVDLFAAFSRAEGSHPKAHNWTGAPKKNQAQERVEYQQFIAGRRRDMDWVPGPTPVIHQLFRHSTLTACFVSSLKTMGFILWSAAKMHSSKVRVARHNHSSITMHPNGFFMTRKRHEDFRHLGN